MTVVRRWLDHNSKVCSATLFTIPDGFQLLEFDDNYCIIFKKKDDVTINSVSIDQIVSNTQNTWEKSRSITEKQRNTRQGKIAEDFFVELINEGNRRFDRKLLYTSYDEFRVDAFKNHAPFDGLLCEANNPRLNQAKSRVLQDLAISKSANVSDKVLQLCRQDKVYTVEIKSSKVPNRCYCIGQHGENIAQQNRQFYQPKHQALLLKKLAQLDYFKYPKYNRDSATIINDSRDYLNWVRADACLGSTNASNEQIIECEYASTLDIYTRIFTDFTTTDSYICYVMGYALRDEFYQDFKVQNFFSSKSKNSLYVTCPIEQCNNFFAIFADCRLW